MQEYMFTHWSLYGGDMNDIIYDAEGAPEGQYGCTCGPIWDHMRADMGSHVGQYGII